MTLSAEYTIEQIRLDLGAFADAGTTVHVERAGARLEARWDQRRKGRRATFARGVSGLEVEFDGSSLPYSAFLASESMADLRTLASTMTRVMTPPASYVELRARIDSDDTDAKHRSSPATQLIGELIQQNAGWATSLIFVKGDAGCGKTSVLRKLARDRAMDYESATTNQLYLYVDAQGRALARINEAIAAELDDLKAPFGYHAVLPLIRRGCLAVIVDGFDELIGSGGYDEAFSSLAGFISRLDGEGSIVASARSTFYDYSRLRSAAQRVDAKKTLNYDVLSVEVEPWDQSETVKYFELAGVPEPALRYDELAKGSSERNAQLLRKPFYVAQVARLLTEDGRLDTSADFLPQVIDFFVSREVDKLKDTEATILTKEQHYQILCAVAEEMWLQETRQLDIPTLHAIAEVFGDANRLPPGQIVVLRERLTSYALLIRSGERRGFEHEVFFAFFAARYLATTLREGSGADIRRALSRAQLDHTLVEETRSVLPDGQLLHVMQRLAAAIPDTAGDYLARRNAGSIVAKVVSGRSWTGLTLRNIVVSEWPLVGTTLRECTLANCRLEDVDLRKCVFDRVTLSGTTTLSFARVDLASTRLPGTRVNIHQNVIGLVVYDSSGRERLTDPSQVGTVLQRLGAVVEGLVAPPQPAVVPQVVELRVELIDRLLSKMRRVFRVSPTDDGLSKRVFGQPEWANVNQLLRQHGVLHEVKVNRKGPDAVLLQLAFPPDEIERGQDPRAEVAPAIRAFWRDIRVP